MAKVDLLNGRPRGGFGTVHLAELRTTHGLARRVALKVLHADLDPTNQGVARMRDEAHVLARLNHPVIVAVEDLVEFDGRVGLVIEHVDGEDLSVCIAAANPIPLRAALEVTGLVAGALDEAWRKLLLVHRDVKPANVRIGRHGTVKLLDFGIARSQVVARNSEKTQANVLVGSVRYVAPERFAMVDEPGPASDVFALGCVLFEAATRTQLFADLDVHDLLRLTEEQESFDAWMTPRLSAASAAASLPEPVRLLLTEMLAFEAVERPSTSEVAVRCEALAEAIGAPVGLRAWCRGRTWPEEVTAEASWDTPADPAPLALAPAPSRAPAAPTPARSLGPWLALGLVLPLLALFVLLSILLAGGLVAAWDPVRPTEAQVAEPEPVVTEPPPEPVPAAPVDAPEAEPPPQAEPPEVDPPQPEPPEVDPPQADPPPTEPGPRPKWTRTRTDVGSR